MLRDTPEMSEETRQEILEMADKVEMVMERADSFDDISMRNMEERRQHSDSKFVTFKQRGFSTLIDIMLVSEEGSDFLFATANLTLYALFYRKSIQTLPRNCQLTSERTPR